MPHYEIHALDPVTNVLVTSVIQTDGSPSVVRDEVRKGGLQPLRVILLDHHQVEIYERMRIMATKRNVAGMAIGGDNGVLEKPKILWGRVVVFIGLPLLAIVATALLLF